MPYTTAMPMFSMDLSRFLYAIRYLGRGGFRNIFLAPPDFLQIFSFTHYFDHLQTALLLVPLMSWERWSRKTASTLETFNIQVDI